MFVSHLLSPSSFTSRMSSQNHANKQGMVGIAALCSSQIYLSALPCLLAIQPKHVKEILCS